MKEVSDERSSTPSQPQQQLVLPSISLEDAMESVVRITLSGLGGSMLGLSQEKKFQSMRVVTGAAATAAARRKRSPVERQANFPLQWAISCMAFCAIIETSRRLEPSRRVLKLLVSDEGESSDGIGNDTLSLSSSRGRLTAFGCSVVDYMIGGGMGGLAASMGRNTHLRKQLPPSLLLRGSQRFFGVMPGIGLGFVAGVFQASTDMGISYLEEMERQQQ